MKNLKRNMLVLIATSLIGSMAACNSVTPTSTAIPTVVSTVSPIDEQRVLTIGGMERTYFLHIPSGLNDHESVPLVFVFHGFQENGAFARNYTGMDKIADANRFIVVYPDGSGPSGSLSWNASGCCGYALQNNVDEPAFVRAIIADVEAIVKVDSRRTYAAGFSNGALLSYRLACEMSGTFAAIAPASGVLMYSPCQPQQPVSIMHVHGINDRVVPIEGGGSGIQFPPVEESLAAWAQLDGCSGEEPVEKDGVLAHTTYGSCKPGVSVELYVVDGTGHGWPSQYIAPISQMIWDFFSTHPKP